MKGLPATFERRKQRLRGLFGMAAALCLAAPAAAQVPPPDARTASPQFIVNWLYLDLAELAGPRPNPPAVWPTYLSRDTARIYQRLRAMDAEAGYDTFDYDWLCQCNSRLRIKVPPRLSMVEKPTELTATLNVSLSIYGGNATHLKLYLVYEDGWKINDIQTDDGKRFRTEIVRGIEDHKRGRKPLRKQLPD